MVEVFGIPLLTTEKFANATEGGKNKLQHVASILAELLDNDNDGCADDPNVLAQLLKPLDKKTRKTFLLLNKQGVSDLPRVEAEVNRTYGRLALDPQASYLHHISQSTTRVLCLDLFKDEITTKRRIQ